jgi:hypothetical protein
VKNNIETKNNKGKNIEKTTRKKMMKFERGKKEFNSTKIFVLIKDG